MPMASSAALSPSCLLPGGSRTSPPLQPATGARAEPDEARRPPAPLHGEDQAGPSPVSRAPRSQTAPRPLRLAPPAVAAACAGVAVPGLGPRQEPSAPRTPARIGRCSGAQAWVVPCDGRCSLLAARGHAQGRGAAAHLLCSSTCEQRAETGRE